MVQENSKLYHHRLQKVSDADEWIRKSSLCPLTTISIVYTLNIRILFFRLDPWPRCKPAHAMNCATYTNLWKYRLITKENSRLQPLKDEQIRMQHILTTVIATGTLTRQNSTTAKMTRWLNKSKVHKKQTVASEKLVISRQISKGKQRKTRTISLQQKGRKRVGSVSILCLTKNVGRRRIDCALFNLATKTKSGKW